MSSLNPNTSTEKRLKVALPPLFGTDAPRFVVDLIQESIVAATRLNDSIQKRQNKLESLRQGLEQQIFPRSLNIPHELNISENTRDNFGDLSTKLRNKFKQNILAYKHKQTLIFIELCELELQQLKQSFKDVIPLLMKKLLHFSENLFPDLQANTTECSFADFSSYILSRCDDANKRKTPDPSMSTQLTELAQWLLLIPTKIHHSISQHRLQRLVQRASKSLASVERQKHLDSAEQIELELPTSEKVAQLVDKRISVRLQKISKQLRSLSTDAKVAKNDKAGPSRSSGTGSSTKRQSSRKSSQNVSRNNNRRNKDRATERSRNKPVKKQTRDYTERNKTNNAGSVVKKTNASLNPRKVPKLSTSRNTRHLNLQH